MKKTYRKSLIMIIFACIYLCACTNKYQDNQNKENSTTNLVEKTTELTEKPTETSTQAMTQKPTETSTQAMTQKPTETTTQAMTQKPTEMTTQALTEKPTETTTQEITSIKISYRKDTGSDSLNVTCDKILDKIITEGMSERDRAYAIYDWVENNIRYSGTTEMNGYVDAAILTFAKGKGNCYGFYSASAALLTREGFENMEIHETDKSHVWNLVKVDGNWYHFDTTTGWGGERFLWTDSQMKSYVYWNKSLGENISYHWDSSAFPATP